MFYVLLWLRNKLFIVDPGGSVVGYAVAFVGRGNIFFLVLSQGDEELFLVFCREGVEERSSEAAMSGAIAQSIRYNFAVCFNSNL